MTIERTYGQIKRRFPILKNGLRFRKPEDSANMIVAAACIFNICIINNDLMDFQEPIDREYIREEELPHHLSEDVRGVEKRNFILHNFIQNRQ